MSTAPTSPLAGGSIDLTPGVVALAPGAGTRTRTCTSCGERRATRRQPTATQVPAWFHISGAVFFGVGYYGAISRLWTRGPIAAANHQYHQNALHHAVLLVAPVLVPLAYLGLLGVLGLILFRARELSLSVCAPCGRRERRFRVAFALAGPALVGLVTLVLQQSATFTLPILAVGVVLLPFVFARHVLRRVLPGLEGGVALGRLPGRGWLVSVPAATETVLRNENPDALLPEGPLDKRYRWGWALPIVLLVFTQLAIVSYVRAQACPYGAVPMTWTEMDQRHAGCMTPLGERQGRWVGKKNGAVVWEATFRFDHALPGTRVRYDEPAPDASAP